MEVGERDASSSSDSVFDSDATQFISSSVDSASESSDDARLNAPLAPTGNAILPPVAPVLVDLAEDDDDEEEAEFEILPAAPMARNDTRDVDDTLPVGLVDGSTRATREAANPSRKRKRLRQADSKNETDIIKPEPPAKPTIIIKPQPTECTVCYDPCTLSGRHRLVSLKCGHVFGKKCIDRWVLERKTCPNCSLAVRKADIRPLFTDHVAVVDTSGLEDMTQKYEAEKSRRIESETKLSRVKLQLQLLQQNATRFQDEAKRWSQQVGDLDCRAANKRFTAGSSIPSRAEPPPAVTEASPSTGFSPLLTFPTSDTGGGGFVSQPFQSTPPRPFPTYASQSAPAPLSTPGATYRELFQYPLQSSRVCAFSSSSSIICVGEALGPTSFGIVKLSTTDPRHAVRIATHSSAIRDVSVSPQDDLVLSVAWDGKAVVSSLRSDTVVMQYTLPPTRRNAWSCSFSPVDPFGFFCGFQDGTIAQYDMRRQATAGGAALRLYELPLRQPVHSITLCPMLGDHEHLVAGTFSGFGVWSSDTLRSPAFSAETSTRVSSFHAALNCCAVSSAQTKRSHVVVTTRSQPPTVSAKHTIYEVPTMIGGSTDLVVRASIDGFRTPQAMSRPAVWESRNHHTMVASWNDAAKHVSIWDASSKQVEATLASDVRQPVVDVQHVIADGVWRRAKALLGVLSPQRLVVYASSD